MIIMPPPGMICKFSVGTTPLPYREIEAISRAVRRRLLAREATYRFLITFNRYDFSGLVGAEVGGRMRRHDGTSAANLMANLKLTPITSNFLRLLSPF